MPQDSPGQTSQEWAALFYLCGHFNRTGEQDPFVAALEEIRSSRRERGDVGRRVSRPRVRRPAHRAAARRALGSEFLGAVNSGDPENLEQFLQWAFDACPARRYVLVMAGLGIMDADSVVGRPPFDSGRLFAICDDRATNDAIELHELSATLKARVPG